MYVHEIIVFCLSVMLSQASSLVAPIDGVVWQYNVEHARTTSAALDASQAPPTDSTARTASSHLGRSRVSICVSWVSDVQIELDDAINAASR